MQDPSTKLLRAAEEEVAERGYDGARIRSIADRAGLTTGAVYSRFSGKEDLLVAALTRSPNTTLLTGDAPAKEVIRRAGALTYALGPDQVLVLEALLAARRVEGLQPGVRAAQEGWMRSVRPVLERGVAEGDLDDDLDLETLAVFLRVVGLGSMTYLAAGLPAPDAEAWDALLGRLVDSLSTRSR